MAFRFRPTDANLDGDGAKKKVAAFDKAVEKCANAFMAKHIQQWYKESLSNPYNKLQFVYKRALEAITQHPERILRIRDVTKIKGIGDVMAKRLDEVVKAEIGGENVGEEEVATFLRNQPGEFAVAEILPSAPGKKTTSTSGKRKRDYIPAYRSGPYAMLIALLLEKQQPNSKGHLLKDEICPLGQPYCSVVMDEGTFSALNGAIKTLVDKELVQKWGSPAKFALTEAGAELALKLWDSGERRSSMPDPIRRRTEVETVDVEPSPPTFSPGSSEFQSCCWSAHSYDIVLLVDVREVKSRDDRDFIIDRLCQSGIKAEQRNLDLGDFLFVARLRPSNRQGDPLDSEEVVLDLVIERKREDDLLSSIPDGRFMEQKYRLIHSGITKLIYLVEEIEKLEFGGIRREQFIAALIQTQVTDGLFLKYTMGLEDTIKFLVSLYQQWPLDQPLHFGATQYPLDRGNYLSNLHRHSQMLGQRMLMTYAAYCQLNSKSGNINLRSLFIKQLLCIRMITPERALLIVERFPTPSLLRRHYRELPDDRVRVEYFKDLTLEKSGMKFGPQASKNVCEVFWRPVTLEPAPAKKKRKTKATEPPSQVLAPIELSDDCVIIL